ncbi:GntR family transcriptional regulator [Marinococcus halotolerans]|uniref:GntR family transcriptional regulator n=1 Tax=Marinococcus halotolerans TaxID=301092 RepID=UPI0003B3BE25|nr:GntR family transcriptional regulator [Marinococcus halotolerans]
MKINKKSPLPIYYQIQEMIRGKLESGEWPPGYMLPSERIFAEEFDVSRMTVRQAVTELVSEQLLTREKGKGTFVAEHKIEQMLQGLTSFTEDMKARGMKASSELQLFQMEEADAATARLLQLKGGSVYRMERLRLADNKPMALENSYLHAEMFPGLGKEAASGSIYNRLEQDYGITIGSADQSLEASLASEREAELLGIAPGAPVLLISRTTYTADGEPFEHVISSYRGDRYKFRIHMPR